MMHDLLWLGFRGRSPFDSLPVPAGFTPDPPLDRFPVGRLEDRTAPGVR